MEIKRISSLLILCILLDFSVLRAESVWMDNQSDSTVTEFSKQDPQKKKKEKDPNAKRTGWTCGILPSVAYDADLGFQYGALANVYYFGDGSTYPEYIHSLYFEAAYTTRRYGVFRFSYDSKFLIPNHRLTIDASYLPDAMCDFSGFNGYQSVYNDVWRNSKKYTAEEGYKSRAFYKFKRDLFRVSADIQGNIAGSWFWNSGIGLLGYLNNSVDIAMLNKGKKESKMLPDIDGLYDKYITWGLIQQNEKNGGIHPYLRGGITYDSRDRQMNSTKGIYGDVFLTYSAGFNSKKFGDQREFNNLRFNFDFRHYVPVYQDYITFAYRLSTQLTVAGKSPFYMNNYLNTLYIQRVLYEAVGGCNTVRGLLRNRVLANGFAFANVEFRFKVCKFKVKKENFYIGLNPFVDAGMILQPYDVDQARLEKSIAENDPTFDRNELSDYFNFDHPRIYRPHFSGGIGLKAAMNDNFVLSVDWAVPFNREDNPSFTNFYVKIGYMF